MNIKSKVAVALSALTLAASLAVPASSAQAGHHGRWGIGAAIVGGAIVGGAIASEAAYGGYYADGYRRCRWERQYDSYGFYVGTVRVCRVY
jgi:hypothetical protein